MLSRSGEVPYHALLFFFLAVLKGLLSPAPPTPSVICRTPRTSA